MTLKNRLEARRGGDADRGDLVQTVLLIAGFAIVAILIVTWLGTAILNKGADASACIQSSTNYNGKTFVGNSGMPNYTDVYAPSGEVACSGNTSSSHGFQSDSGYQSRYS